MKIVIAGDNHGEKDSLKKIVQEETSKTKKMPKGDIYLRRTFKNG